jgi:hypothetical protein
VTAVEQDLPLVGLDAGGVAGPVGPEVDGGSFGGLEDGEATVQQDEVLAQPLQERPLVAVPKPIVLCIGNGEAHVDVGARGGVIDGQATREPDQLNGRHLTQ